MADPHRAARTVRATPGEVYAAMVDPELLLRWLPPTGMSGRLEHFDPRPGGSYRLVLTYDGSATGTGKSSSDSDVVEARFVELVPGARVVHAVDFVSDDEAFAGTMTMVWEIVPVAEGTRVEISAHDVPRGISAADHQTGMTASLDGLARLLEGP
ncbi:uncharacterized protein YndB with AHSA1/START domain [Motilibacter rhizosphaerae]|uniref:Uncharacterized protein YndB with AHSA1/START domain n=1 Tax=Motilibacter rhizosphaerae TaxID=598652 RepID=A0A4Q7N7A6_9ACTN|nr:SRPBCC domain-containing protein [Motilibacter rhizosphaerae]RZS77525.1 uncharacterized protein YndB with AHSA1/START domain [Motilibacter rhizosphaerae]